MEITGVIKRINETKEVGASNFKVRDIHIQTMEQYPQILSIQFVQDKTAILDNYKVGQEVTIAINLRGREWTNPQDEVIVFNTLQGWRISGGAKSAVDAYKAKTTEPDLEVEEEEDDSLPF